MAFVTRNAEPARSSSPETLFRDLSRTTDGPRHLWAHQADILRAYLDHVAHPDLAIELPTGAGKTLVGMLIAEWRRRVRNERVVYLCPTIQLARQALADARRAGIAAVDLTGPSRHWDSRAEHQYRSADALAIAHYGSVFNSKPKLNDAHVLVFDDAHAAAGTIADTWTVRLESSDPGYGAVINLLQEGLPTAAAQRYLTRAISGAQWQDAHLVAPATVAAHVAELSALLNRYASDGDVRFGWQMIQDSLDACAVFVAADELLVRPVVAPTSTHAAYTEPRQRIYLSATLGSGGELERAFGRTGITRMPVPAGWDERGTGRRFFVFPELIRDFARAGEDEAVRSDMHRFVSDLMEQAGRTVLLAPSSRALRESRDALVPDDRVVVEAMQIRESLEPFLAQSPAVLALANRYDGIDLPDHACRAIVMTGLPVGADAQERFFAFTLGAKRVLQERMRTRFAQGSGRATRNANDWALVIVLGRDLVAFCGQKDAQNETHPEIRAELEFGLNNSYGQTADEVATNVRSFLDQDDIWRGDAEPWLRATREAMTTERQADTIALAASAPFEVRAVDSAWRGDWQRALQHAERAIAALAGGAELRPYQAFWNFVAAQWARQAARLTGDVTFDRQADDLSGAARAAAARTTWLPSRQIGRHGHDDEPEPQEVDPLDRCSAEGVVTFARSLKSGRKITRAVNEMVADLQGTRADDYERGLVALGRFLGATSSKPSGEARADALWRWGSTLWIAWEAKSEVKAENSISASAIRQANSHLRGAVADLDEELPPGSLTVLVSPQSTVDPAARALSEEALCISTTGEVAGLADRVAQVWLELQGRLTSDSSDEDLATAVLVAFRDADVQPSALVATLRGNLF